ERVGRIADLFEQLVRHVVARPLADELAGRRLVKGDDALLAADQLRQLPGEPAICLADVGHGLEGARDLLQTPEPPVAPARPEEPADDSQRGGQASHWPP